MLHNLDSDSSKIIEAVRSTGVVITEAMRLYVDYIVSNMKAIGTWDLCNAVYGFVGGTADSHKWNWKDLRDVDAAYRLVFSGSWTHSSLGAKPNNSSTGGNIRANTFLSLQGFESAHFIVFTTNENTFLTGSSVDIGAQTTIASVDLSAKRTDLSNRAVAVSGNYSTTSAASVIQSNIINQPVGCFVSNRINNSNFKFYKNTSLIGTATGTVAPAIFASDNYVLLGGNKDYTSGLNSSASNRRHSFDAIGLIGLTDTQAIQQSQIITNAQLILNRA